MPTNGAFVLHVLTRLKRGEPEQQLPRFHHFSFECFRSRFRVGLASVKLRVPFNQDERVHHRVLEVNYPKRKGCNDKVTRKSDCCCQWRLQLEKKVVFLLPALNVDERPRSSQISNPHRWDKSAEQWTCKVFRCAEKRWLWRCGLFWKPDFLLSTLSVSSTSKGFWLKVRKTNFWQST